MILDSIIIHLKMKKIQRYGYKSQHSINVLFSPNKHGYRNGDTIQHDTDIVRQQFMKVKNTTRHNMDTVTL